MNYPKGSTRDHVGEVEQGMYVKAWRALDRAFVQSDWRSLARAGMVLNRILRYVALVIVCSAAARAQDCIISFAFTAAAQTSSVAGCGHNKTGITEWRMTYYSTGFSALSILVQSAPDSSGSAGTFVAFAGTVIAGTNPNTATTSNAVQLSGYYPWMRVRLTSVTGSGLITGTLYGCRSPGCAGTVNVSATISGTVTVSQESASSAAADAISNTEVTPTDGSANPFYGRAFSWLYNNVTWDRLRGNTTGLSPSSASSANADGISNTNTGISTVGSTQIYNRVLLYLFNGIGFDRLRGNTSGMSPSSASSAAADGVSNTEVTPTDSASAVLYGRNFPFRFYGSTWDREFGCPSSVIIDDSASGNTQIIAASGSAQIRICKVSLTTAGSVSVKFTQGTGANCVTGTADLSGLYQNVLGIAEDFQANNAALVASASQAVCLNLSGATRTTGMAWYARY